MRSVVPGLQLLNRVQTLQFINFLSWKADVINLCFWLNYINIYIRNQRCLLIKAYLKYTWWYWDQQIKCDNYKNTNNSKKYEHNLVLHQNLFPLMGTHEDLLHSSNFQWSISPVMSQNLWLHSFFFFNIHHLPLGTLQQWVVRLPAGFLPGCVSSSFLQQLAAATTDKPCSLRLGH